MMEEPVRVYLRRVMYNSDRAAEPVQLSEEDKRRTIISIQGGKSFGRGEHCDVLFLDESEIVEREPQYISPVHAHIHHFTEDNLYYLEDHSENGTYINDRRLRKNTKELLRVGDTIKFGHKEGLEHVAGQIYPNPEADFAFCATMARPGEQVYTEIENIKGSKVKVFIGSQFVEAVEDKNGVSPRITRQRREVQQQEADSTDGRFHDSMEGSHPERSPEATASSSIASPSLPNGKPAHGSTPSTSSAPISASNSEESSSNGTSAPSVSSKPVVNGASNHTALSEPSTSQVLCPPNIPKRAPRISHPLHICMYSTTRFCPHYQERIGIQAGNMVKAQKVLSGIDPDLLITFLDQHVAHEKHTSREQKMEFINSFLDSNNPAEVAAIAKHKELLADELVRLEPETNEIRKYVNETYEKRQKDKKRMRVEDFEHSTDGPFRRHQFKGVLTPLALMIDSERAYIEFVRKIAEITPYSNILLEKRLENLNPVDTLTNSIMMAIQSIAGLNKLQAQEPFPDCYLDVYAKILEMIPGKNTVIVPPGGAFKPNEVEGDEEERHSASSGSATETCFRRRTDSDMSLIDVVGTNDDDNNDEDKDGTETDNTPTPTPEDGQVDIIQALKNSSEQSKMDMTDDGRKSSTPRIDAQSTPSAVVSAGPTPLGSPVPKSVPIASPKASSIPSTSSTTTVSSVEALVNDVENEKVEKAENNKPSTSTPSAPTTSESKKKQTKERRNKQLDESSQDSESDDDVKKSTPPGKKKVRRSTRGPKEATPAAAKKDVVDGEEPEEEATPVAPKRKNLKRSASQAALKVKRSPKEKGTGDEADAPKKRRGRKKVPQDEDGDVDEDGVEKNGALDVCGVMKTGYCISKKFEKKHDLEWVSCSGCEQWYHTFCVRMVNNKYLEEESFACCGVNVTEEGRQVKEGTIFRKYNEISERKRPTPGTPDRSK